MNVIQQEACRAIVNIFETGRVRGDYGAVGVLPVTRATSPMGAARSAWAAATCSSSSGCTARSRAHSSPKT